MKLDRSPIPVSSYMYTTKSPSLFCACPAFRTNLQEEKKEDEVDGTHDQALFFFVFLRSAYVLRRATPFTHAFEMMESMRITTQTHVGIYDMTNGEIFFDVLQHAHTVWKK